MKKVVGILFLILIILTTASFAAFPAELEGNETEEGLEEFGTLEEKNENVNYDHLVMPIDETYEPSKQNVIKDDIYKIDEEVVIDNEVDGNIYVIGQTVKLNKAMIYGNVYIIAEKVEIIDSQMNSAYILGEEIYFSGTANDLYACGSNVTTEVESSILRNLKVGADTLNIKGNIGRNVDATINQLNVAETAKIIGKLNYYSMSKGNISEKAQISQIEFVQEEVQETDEPEENEVWDNIYEVIVFSFKTLIVALIVVLCVNKFQILKRSENVVIDFSKALGKGTAFLILVPMIVITLICTVIGIGFGFVALAIYVIAFYVATPIFAIEIATRIVNKKSESSAKKSQIIALSVLVSIIIWALKFIPVLGGILRFIIILIGLGIIFNLMFEKNKKEIVNEN